MTYTYKGNSNTVIAIIVILLVVVGLGIWTFKNKNLPENAEKVENQATQPLTNETSPNMTNPAPIPGSPSPMPQNPPGQPMGQITQIMIKNFAFNPQTITVKPGTTVIWTNSDSTAHTITSGSFDSGNLPPGGSFRWTFTTPGTYDYHCSIHPSMTGKVVVQQ